MHLSRSETLQVVSSFVSEVFFLINFSTATIERTPKRNPTKVKVATKKTKDYDNPVVKHWTIFARYVSNHIPDIFITVLYTLVLIAIFAERAYCK